MHRKFARILGLILVALALQTLPALASAAPGRAPSLAPTLSAGDLLVHFRAWLGTIWPDNGCTADPDGAHCIVPPPGNPSAGTAPAPRAGSSTPTAGR